MPNSTSVENPRKSEHHHRDNRNDSERWSKNLTKLLFLNLLRCQANFEYDAALCQIFEDRGPAMPETKEESIAEETKLPEAAEEPTAATLS